MEKDIDDILADLLNKEPINEDEKQQLEEWSRTSVQNENIERLIKKLGHQKTILDKHQKQEAVYAKIERQIRQAKRRYSLIFLSSCAAGIMLLTGLFFILQQEKPLKKENTGPIHISKLHSNRPTVELILPDGEKRMLSQEQHNIIVSDDNSKMHTQKQTLIVESIEQETREPEYYTMKVPLGAEYNLILPDGTKIYLNAGSSLRYPDQFTGEKREVFLTGEAYFEVTPDTLHPFIVQTTDVTIRVLGTAFNVNAYSDGAWVKTTLVKGRVVTRCGENNFIMKPGTQVAYNKDTRKAAYFPVEIQRYTSWKDGYYDFEEMPLGELMQIFSRWYNVKIEFADPQLKKVKFSGRLKRYDDLKPLFEILEYTRDIKFIMDDDKIIIQKK